MWMTCLTILEHLEPRLGCGALFKQKCRDSRLDVEDRPTKQQVLYTFLKQKLPCASVLATTKIEALDRGRDLNSPNDSHYLIEAFVSAELPIHVLQAMVTPQCHDFLILLSSISMVRSPPSSVVSFPEQTDSLKPWWFAGCPCCLGLLQVGVKLLLKQPWLSPQPFAKPTT